MKTLSTQTAEAGTVAGRLGLKFRLHPIKHKKKATRKTLGPLPTIIPRKKTVSFYAHDEESLSLYVVLLCLAFANFKIDLADAGSNAARKCAAAQEIGSRRGTFGRVPDTIISFCSANASGIRFRKSPLRQRKKSMSIKVLLADDSDVMRSAIRRILEDEPRIVVVGEAATFAKTIQMIRDLKPEVLLLDLHMAEKRAFQPELVKSQLACVCALAVSFSNDAEARQLAESYGAVALLDKMKLFDEMIPAIMQCKSERSAPPKRAHTA